MDKKVKYTRFETHCYEFLSKRPQMAAAGWHTDAVDDEAQPVEAPRRGRPPKVRD